LGLYPTAWYPTGLLCDRNGLCVLSSKGTGSGPNADGRYIGHMINGLLSRLPLRPPANGAAAVARNNGYPPALSARAGLPAAIRHCILIVRENRTYDQDLGDRSAGNGDPSLTMFGRRITPNLHALADRFATGDNFYSDGEVSAQGHQWTLGANCPDYVEKTWMAYYSDRGRIRDSTYAPVSYPASDWAMEHCARHGVSCRMYGDPVRIGPSGSPLPLVADKVDTRYRGWDLDTPDMQRAAEWKREFNAGIFPAFSYLWLPNDHTAGARIGSKTPRALVADNDEATGLIVDAISHSRFWKETAIFVIEDDSQDGRDHVDAHRNILLIASPWTRPGALTSRHYSQASVYATIERLLHLPPMCQYDALAAPITDVWSSTPDMRPYHKIAALVPTDERNTARSVMAAESSRLDLEDADADKTGLLETILWRYEQGNREQGTGNREEGRGNREKRKEKREKGRRGRP
ncbi:MAG TPA: alkaline phosphatase family protein, partial [Chthonomonadaceae bacterium]|nr:alkaline phosphatase family protein [Chthonomonadaceae bacterium]